MKFFKSEDFKLFIIFVLFEIPLSSLVYFANSVFNLKLWNVTRLSFGSFLIVVFAVNVVVLLLVVWGYFFGGKEW